MCLHSGARSASADPAENPFITSTTTETELSAIGRMRNWRAGKGGCTAVLIAPRLAATAAHCVTNQRLSSLIFDPTNLPNLKRMAISQVILHPDFSGSENLQSVYADLAFLVMAAPVPEDYATPIPIGRAAEPGKSYAVYGFMGPDNPPMQGHPTCQIVRISPGLLGSDCAVRPGMSGSPLLAGGSPEWSVAGIIVATVEDAPGGVRTLIAEIDRSLLPPQFYPLDTLPPE